MADSLDIQAEMLSRKIKHYLITMLGKTINECNSEEFYRCFCSTIREEIMVNWTATAHTNKKTQSRMLYYLCMEYMPGRLLGNNLTNIHAIPLVKKVLKILNRNLSTVLAQEPEIGLGNGGLGRLAACFIDSLATQQYPSMAYGLRYQYGIFDQEIWNGMQVERPDGWLLHENPWEFRRDAQAVSVNYGGKAASRQNKAGVEVHDLQDCDEVRALSYDIPIIGYKEGNDFNVNTLRIWTTKESPRNFKLQRFNAGHLDEAAENTSLTDVLYPNDHNELGKRIRLKQEFLLASASVQDIMHHFERNYTDIALFADKIRIHINDTHPAFVIAELMRLLLGQWDLSWEASWEIVQTCCNFTNHTVLQESLEQWSQTSLQHLLPRQYYIIEKLNWEFCNKIRKKFPGDEERVRRMSIIENGEVKMAHLAIYGSHRVNGVAELHTKILKEKLFKDFYEMYPEKFVNVTNGVTQRRWLLYCNPELAAFISKRIGASWIDHFPEIQALKKFAKDAKSGKEFLEIKKQNKERLIRFIKEEVPLRDCSGNALAHFDLLGPDALFDVQIKRFHEYKRQLLSALHTLILYQELLANPEARLIKRQVIYAGKAAPGYTIAKHIIHFIFCIARKINLDPKVNQKLQVVFVENYNVSRAELIIPAADLSEQISTAGLEASGTGNMKLSMNGALTIGTQDGSNVEMHAAVGDAYWPFSFGASAQENEVRGSYNPQDIYANNLKIKKALDALKDKSLSQDASEEESLSAIYDALLDRNGDRYFVLRDLESYYQTQKKVEALFLEPEKWAEYAIYNMACMGPFSSDESIEAYAQKVWNLKKCPVDPKELQMVREEYSEHDKCRIF